MRTISLVFVFLGVTAPLAWAETPWEAYLSAPSSAAAAVVQKAEYSVPDENNRKFESDLTILENEVASGEPESIKLAARLGTQFANAAAISEYLDAILGRAIRPNPVGYLRAIADASGCPGAFPSGDLFVDRSEARIAEARARETALKSVKVGELTKKRDECIAKLAKVD